MADDARLHAILNRSRPHEARRAEFSHFALDHGRPVPADIVTDSPAWTLYSLDRDRNAALFLEMPEGLDLAAGPFSYSAQFTHARRALVAPLAALERLAARIALPDRLVFLFSIARCRSTLTARMLGRLPGVWSLGEPDAFMNLAMDRARYGANEARDLVAACVRLAYRPPPGGDHAAFVVKPRSQAVFLAGAFHRAFPDAACLFLYRDAEGWAQSVYRMLHKLGIPLEGRDARAFIWHAFTAAAPESGIAAEAAHPEEILAAAWAAQLEHYLRERDAGVPWRAFHHDDLAGDPGPLRRLLAACDLDDTGLPLALASYTSDSQADTAIARDREATGFDDAQRDRLRALLARHPRISSGALRLPDGA